jgi:YggT family protein
MLFEIIHVIFQVYLILLFARIIASWFPEIQRHRLMLFINFYTDPYLNFFRKFIPPLGMFDISPIIAIFCLGFIEKFVKIFVSFFIS